MNPLLSVMDVHKEKNDNFGINRMNKIKNKQEQQRNTDANETINNTQMGSI